MISARQRHLLRKIKRNPGYTYTSKEKLASNYLKSIGYISITNTGGDRWGAGSIPTCNITELGKAYLYNEFTTLLRFTIPVIVSFCSLIVSVIALILSL